MDASAIHVLREELPYSSSLVLQEDPLEEGMATHSSVLA